MEKYLDLKTAITMSLARLTNVKEKNIDISHNDIVLITAAGTLYGEYVEDLSKSDEHADWLFAYTEETANKLTSPNDTQLPITLKNVTLITGDGSRQRFDTLIVFPSDVIAVTIKGRSES